MNHEDVQRWLDAYVDAWRTYRPDSIAALFTGDAVYRYRPYGGDDDAVLGSDAIVESWLEAKDEPDTWSAEYSVYAVDGDRAVAIGWSAYLAGETSPAKTYRNCFLLRFDVDGRCAEFTEFYMEEPPAGS